MKQEKLDEILKTARKLFARYGLKKTNLDEIARLARVAKGTIYNYFGSKDRVYMEVLNREADEILESVLSSVERETSPDKKLVSFVRAKFKYMHRAVNILNLDKEGIENLLPSAEKIRDDFFNRENNIIVSILKEGIEKGTFKTNDILLTARAIGYALKGFELNWLVQESEELIEHYLDELLKLLFFGIMSEKGVKDTA
ncbi:MAG: TetR/AcrR family transcriptional regulator [Deltaproteobacteria bacterium]|uniref:TetR/AcrR family transcriptional regulator n=1 Tax=Candidatus Zymogenus saltonus TaxID=2844893 RepID=A0A9D8KLM0_9DELT|nr:TetR/AcrR family transcriptional regulator [Candidatus Zymogenus saltonus]